MKVICRTLVVLEFPMLVPSGAHEEAIKAQARIVLQQRLEEAEVVAMEVRRVD